MKVEYNNGLQPRSRRVALVVVAPAETGRIVFTWKDGEDLPGILLVVGSRYEKNGKWSNTTYQLELADGVKAVSISQSWEEGMFWPSLTWETLFEEALLRLDGGLTDEEIERFIRSDFPKTATRLDEKAALVSAPSVVQDILRQQAEKAAAQEEASRTVAEKAISEVKEAAARQFLSQTDAMAFVLQDGALLRGDPVLLGDAKGWFHGNPNGFGLDRIVAVAATFGLDLPFGRKRDLDEFLALCQELAMPASVVESATTLAAEPESVLASALRKAGL